MNELSRALATKAMEDDPTLGPAFDEFEAAQAELMYLLDAMGVRSVVVEVPPAGNSDAVLHANVSSTRR